MPKVSLNSKAPDFELSDFSGQEYRLTGFRGEKNILLVFNRGFT